MGSHRRARESVVVPALDAASSVACIRSLSEQNIRTIAVSERPNAPGFSSRRCDETVIVPDPTADLTAYAEALLELAERPDVATIIPVREADVYVLAKHKREFAEHVGTPWPSLETLRTAQDRVELFAAADRAGVAAPATRTFDEWDDWSRDVIIKPRYTIHAAEYLETVTESRTQHDSTRYVETGERPERDALVDEMGHVPLVQEYVPDSDEYALFALYDHGEAVATFQHRQHRGYKYCGGASSFRESVDIPELDAAGRRLLDEMEWHGVAMVEFLRDPETGEFELMEVNPRFWTSLPFTIQAGVDFPYYYWLQATGQVDRIDSAYEVGMAGHLLRGELLYLHSILTEEYPLVERPSFVRALAEVLVSLVRHPRFDYLDATDPGPFVRDARNTLAQLSRTSSSAPNRSPNRLPEPDSVPEGR